MHQGTGFEQRMEHLDALIHQVEAFPDPSARAVAEDVVQALLDLHGRSIARMLEIVDGAGESGQAIMTAIATDDLTRNLLLLHELHPVALEDRVRQALERVRPYMASHGGSIEFLGISDGVVHLRLEGSCHGCPSSLMTLQSSIEKEIMDLAPDVAGIEVEGLSAPPVAPDGFIPLASFAVIGSDG